MKRYSCESENLWKLDIDIFTIWTIVYILDILLYYWNALIYY